MALHIIITACDMKKLVCLSTYKDTQDHFLISSLANVIREIDSEMTRPTRGTWGLTKLGMPTKQPGPVHQNQLSMSRCCVHVLEAFSYST